MKEIFEQALKILGAGQALALATIVESRGSTPREVGAKMIVHEHGLISGTVGGGCGEAQVFQDAIRALRERRPRFSLVDLTGEINENTATNCGGSMNIFIDYLGPGREPEAQSSRQIIESVLDVYHGGRRAVLATVLESNGTQLRPGTKLLITAVDPEPQSQLMQALIGAAHAALESGRSHRRTIAADDSTTDVFLEVLDPPSEIVIVGAGHIAKPLAQMAKIMRFRVTVIDDRSNFANESRFPEADRIIVGEIDEALSDIEINDSTHVVLVTRGHQMDQSALLRIIDSPAVYIGMIGSRRRVRAVFDYLRGQGVSDAALGRVFAPIGIDIGAETPDEIAVAIMSEIVKVHRKGRADSISEHRRRRTQAGS